MKKVRKFFLSLMLLNGIYFASFAQSNDQSNDLIKQGTELHNQGKYAEAVDKFNEVLKTDPENAYINYKIAFSLYVAKKPNDAIPHLQITVKSTDAVLSVPAYCLLASIYDEANQPVKAIDSYNEAIKINPDYPQIYYNLGLAYFRNQKFAEAENSAIEAIKHNPKNASSQRLYALVTFHQNKRVNALMGFCSFLLLEPTGARAAEALSNIQHIMQGGLLLGVPLHAGTDKEMATLNSGITQTVQAGIGKKLTGHALLEFQLIGIFSFAGRFTAQKIEKNFFDNFFAAYFFKLAQTDNMPAFTRAISQNNNPTEYSSWALQNAPLLNNLNDWLKTTDRSF